MKLFLVLTALLACVLQSRAYLLQYAIYTDDDFCYTLEDLTKLNETLSACMSLGGIPVIDLSDGDFGDIPAFSAYMTIAHAELCAENTWFGGANCAASQRRLADSEAEIEHNGEQNVRRLGVCESCNSNNNPTWCQAMGCNGSGRRRKLEQNVRKLPKGTSNSVCSNLAEVKRECKIQLKDLAANELTCMGQSQKVGFDIWEVIPC